MVFLFLHAYAQDDNNVDGVATGYRTIAEQSAAPVVEVPAMSEDATHEFLIAELQRLDLLAD